MKTLRIFFLWLMAAFYIAAGANHFRSPGVYLEIMPPWLPRPLALVYISGAAELLGGFGVLVPRLRRAAGWGLIALLLAVFPANFHMAQDGFRGLPSWVLWGRLPLQLVLIAWVYWCCLSNPAQSESPS